MSLAQVLSTYINLNLLIVIAFTGLGIFAMTLKKINLRLGAQTELKLHYFVILTFFCLTAIHPLLPRSEIFSPAAKVWSAQSIKSFAQDYTAPDKGGYLSLSTPTGTSTLQADQVAYIWMILGLILLLLGSAFLCRDLCILLQTKRNSFLLRKIGNVRIFINDNIQVPFSYWLPWQANIIIPSSLVARREDYKIAIAHEIQHHRHGDTRWVYILWGMKLVCIINPVVHFWNRWLSEIQEFACDETLVDQGRVESQSYARCLVEVAQTAIDQKHVPVCATGLTFLIERNLLKRRIERMFTPTQTKVGGPIALAFGLLVASVMGATAFASKGLVQDRRVSMAQAQAMAVRAQSNTRFPIVVNELVLQQLNRYIGTPEGREFMRDSLARMENYKSVVGENLQKYGVPMEIMAVPIVESGYQNLLEEKNRKVKGAGLWQFIPKTARNYGLFVDSKERNRVDSKNDQRLDISLSTDAAMRYLQSNNLRFKDWQLSALAYNMGETAVQSGMDALDTRDAWTLVRNGFEGDKAYLARVMAAILIMKNPESIQ